MCTTKPSLAAKSATTGFSKAGRPRGRDQRERNLAWPCGLTETGKTQAAEVGRKYSGAFKPVQKRGPKSRAPNSGYGPAHHPGLIPIRRVPSFVRLGRLPERKESECPRQYGNKRFAAAEAPYQPKVSGTNNLTGRANRIARCLSRMRRASTSELERSSWPYRRNGIPIPCASAKPSAEICTRWRNGWSGVASPQRQWSLPESIGFRCTTCWSNTESSRVW